MGMTDLCDPYGDSAMRDGGFLNRFFRSPNLIYLRFSDKPANGFLYTNLTGLLNACRPVIFIFEH